MAVNKTVIAEGIFLLVISLIGMSEVYRLLTYKDPYLVYGVVVPGVFVLVVSIALIIVCVVHVFAHYRDVPDAKKEVVNKKMMIRMISMVVVFAIYIILIHIFGYLIATMVFYVLEFRIVGIKPWLFCFALSLIATVSCYLIFIKYCNVIFPRGILFG